APGSVKLGPSTEPIVVAHTTSDIARPAAAGSARSTAAYRACNPAAVDEPHIIMPNMNSGRNCTATPSSTTPAPSVPTPNPSVSAVRRPARPANAANG